MTTKTMRTGSMVAISTYNVDQDWSVRKQCQVTAVMQVIDGARRSTLPLPLLWLGSCLHYCHLSVWQSILLHLSNQEINDMKGIYMRVFLSTRYALWVQYMAWASNFDIDTYNKPSLGFLDLISSISACGSDVTAAHKLPLASATVSV